MREPFLSLCYLSAGEEAERWGLHLFPALQVVLPFTDNLSVSHLAHIFPDFTDLRQALGHLCCLSHCLLSISCLQGRNRVPEHEAADCFGHQRRQKTSHRGSQPGWLSFLPSTDWEPVARQRQGKS